MHGGTLTGFRMFFAQEPELRPMSEKEKGMQCVCRARERYAYTIVRLVQWLNLTKVAKFSQKGLTCGPRDTKCA